MCKEAFKIHNPLMREDVLGQSQTCSILGTLQAGKCILLNVSGAQCALNHCAVKSIISEAAKLASVRSRGCLGDGPEESTAWFTRRRSQRSKDCCPGIWSCSELVLVASSCRLNLDAGRLSTAMGRTAWLPEVGALLDSIGPTPSSG